jgi:hypothetical protein
LRGDGSRASPEGLLMTGDEVSRRALLGVAVAIPLVGATGAEEAPPPGFTRSPSPGNPGEEWKKALRAFRSAEAEVRAVERATAGSSAEAEEVWLPAYEARLEVHSGAVRGVMLAEAPDFAALAAKLELFFEHELEPSSVEDDVLAALRRDVRRLMG